MIGAEATSGRFEVISRIAAGGMGEVYRARMSSGGGATKQVALKVVLDELADDPQYAEMLIAEARVAMSLSHANVVQAFDAGRLGQRFFLAMEFVDGATVRELLRRQRGPLPTAQLVTIAVEALKGLDYAHRFKDPDTGEPLDIVHRDVSPSNLLVSREGEVKVADFGIAQSTQVEEAEGTVKGKIAYMAPEQIRAEALDRRTDVYAMGVVLYEMLSGARPFGRKVGPDSVHAVEAGTYEPPSAHHPDVDGELERITLKAMSRRPADRYPSAAALRQELERWALDNGVLLSTSDLADYLLDLPEHSGIRANKMKLPAPTLEEGTVLTRAQADADGISLLLPSLDLGAALNDALDVGPPVTGVTRAARADDASAPDAEPAARRTPVGLRAVVFGAMAAAVIGAGLGVVWALNTSPATDAGDGDIGDGEVGMLTSPEPPVDDPPSDAEEVPVGVDPPPLEPLAEVEVEPPALEPAAEPSRRGRAGRRRAESPAEVRGQAEVSIASDPWANVSMDGQPIGRTTINRRTVPAGRHTFSLTNAAAGLSHRFTVTLDPGEQRRFSIDLRDP